MSATATPYGMRPVGVLGGRVNNNAFNSYKIASGYAANVFYGDVVKLVSDGVVEKDTGTATLTPIGVFVGCRFTNPTTKELTFSQYWPTGTVASDAFAYVVDDPYAVFQIQANGSLAQTNLVTTQRLFKPLAAPPSARAKTRWQHRRSIPRTRSRCVSWRS